MNGSTLQTPTVRHIGEPHDVFPSHWSVLEWIEGTDCWSGRTRLDPGAIGTLAVDLALAATAVGQIHDPNVLVDGDRLSAIIDWGGRWSW